MRGKKWDALKGNLASFLDLPEDVLRDLTRVSVVGEERVYVENHKGLVSYTPQLVRINTRDAQLLIAGSGLTVHGVGSEAISVSGTIDRIEYAR